VLVNGVYVKRCVWSPGGQADALWLWFAPDGFGHAQDGSGSELWRAALGR